MRNHTWEKLTRLGLTRQNQTWFVLGDFNEILGNHEKDGGRIRPESSFTEFRSMMRTSDLVDLPAIGDRFSWVGQRGQHLVKCCLDRTMANSTWFGDYSASQTEYLEIGESDHRPLVTYIRSEAGEPRRTFRFDSRMIDKEGFQNTVQRGWNGTGQTQLLQVPLCQRIARCRKHISQWKKTNRNNAEEKIGLLRGRLDRAMTSVRATLQERIALRQELNEAYQEEEVYWKHKSRIRWLRSGDRNTSYFHAVTKAKRIRNTIHSIHDENGVICHGQREVAEAAGSYFANLYAT